MPSTVQKLSKLKPEIVALVRNFECAQDELAAKSKELSLMLLEHTEFPFSRRQFTPGHITCTAVVLDPQRRRALLMFHHRLLRWLLPGGHCEGDDESISGVARREAIEETGVAIDSKGASTLVGIDVHGIPAKKKEPYHLHHDLIFSFRALSESIKITPEAREVAWCAFADLGRYEVAPSIVRSVQRALSL